MLVVLGTDLLEGSFQSMAKGATTLKLTSPDGTVAFTAAQDSATASVETKDLDFGTDALKHVDAIRVKITDVIFLKNVVLRVWHRKDLNDEYSKLDDISLKNGAAPVYLKNSFGQPGVTDRYFKVFVVDSGLLGRWRLQAIDFFGDKVGFQGEL